MDNLQIREMTIEDYDEIFALWQVTTKRALSDADSRENIAKYLEHQQGICRLLAYVTVRLCLLYLQVHDGRRGFIHHMAVSPDYRRMGVGRSLATEADKRIKQALVLRKLTFSVTKTIN